MHRVIEIMDDISTNIEEAHDKIEEAFRLKEHCPQYAEWQAGMAENHIAFNTKGIEVMERMLEKHEKHEERMAFIELWKGQVMKKTAKVRAMIDAFKKL